MALVWIIIFAISLAVLVKGADWLLGSAEKMGLSLGISPFVVGVTIVAVGTSLPELITSFMATTRGLTDVAVANAVGSNIANILLIIGFAGIIARCLSVSKNLIDVDLPLIACSTVLFLGVAYDGNISIPESVILLLSYVFYLIYTVVERSETEEEKAGGVKPEDKGPFSIMDFFKLIIGGTFLSVGSSYLVNSVVELSTIFNIATGIITVTAVAIGTSLPELIVSTKAALNGKAEVAVGNIFGSNVFNILVVVGLPGLFGTLSIDERTFSIGLPTLVVATALFVVSGISKKIHIWEGGFFLVLYVLFIVKLFGLF